YSIFAQAMDRSGFACGTLSPRPGLSAPVPPLDPRPLLTMRDMGHDMGHGAHDMNAGQESAHGGQASAREHGEHMGGTASAHAGHDMQAHRADNGPAAHDMGGAVTHPASEGSLVDMQVMTANDALDDPGVGLRENGRRVLTYADLHTIG